MNKRLTKIRQDAGLSQAEFGEKISVTQNHISSLESGRRILTDRTIKDICTTFNVNEEWLRTGEGEIYMISKEDEELSTAFVEISLSDNDKLKELAQKIPKLKDKYINLVLDLVDIAILEK